MSTELSARTIGLIKATIPALTEHGPAITGAMYRRLFRDAQIARLFNQANQKSGTQRFALSAAILAYARNIDNLPALSATVERIAWKHVGYAILPEHYPYVAEALLGAIAEVLGDAATPEILAAWGEAYWFLAGILKAREAEIRQDLTARPGGWTGWRRFVITERRAESDTIMSFTLRPEDRGPTLAHLPGQYLTLRFDTVGLTGAIGLMTLAVMSRASLGHTGRPLHAGPGTVAIYLALAASVVTRLLAGMMPAQIWLLHMSAALWIAAFGGFAAIYLRILTGPDLRN